MTELTIDWICNIYNILWWGALVLFPLSVFITFAIIKVACGPMVDLIKRNPYSDDPKDKNRLKDVRATIIGLLLGDIVYLVGLVFAPPTHVLKGFLLSWFGG